MKVCRGLLTTTAVLALAGVASAEETVDAEARIASSRTVIKEFASSLKGDLQAAIKSGGPVEAIEVCSDKAPAIAASLSSAHDMQVSRTSLKFRNPDNKPDAWETEVLEQFEVRLASGEPVTAIEFSETVTVGESQAFRYMKAIPTAEVCLNCHGADLPPEVAAQLDELYPGDLARGFKEGDIRGAFSISQSLD